MASTLKDVARATGLSIATISKYLNGVAVKERNRIAIDKAVKELDFRINEIARGLKTNRTMTIGVLIPELENIFSTAIVSNIENILMQHGYSTILCDYKSNPVIEAEKAEFLINKMVDGIITMPYYAQTDSIKRIMDKGIPVILIDRMIEGLDCDCVLVDNLNASYTAVEKIITHGHKNIGIICGPQNIYTTKERLKGYLRVHEDYAMPIDNRLIKHGNYDIQSGYELSRELLELESPPTAIFVTNYEMTLGAIIAFNELNVEIPKQLSFIGFDNMQMALIVKPPLSIVIQPVAQIGEEAANLMLKRLKGDSTGFPTVLRLKTEVTIRESVREI